MVRMVSHVGIIVVTTTCQADQTKSVLNYWLIVCCWRRSPIRKWHGKMITGPWCDWCPASMLVIDYTSQQVQFWPELIWDQVTFIYDTGQFGSYNFGSELIPAYYGLFYRVLSIYADRLTDGQSLLPYARNVLRCTPLKNPLQWGSPRVSPQQPRKDRHVCRQRRTSPANRFPW